ncbi:MAG: hypothetical protein M3232_01190 [Thermoproteota archaeon]|nr:hypothetical protein [Thermoproteota archaeon]
MKSNDAGAGNDRIGGAENNILDGLSGIDELLGLTDNDGLFSEDNDGCLDG